MIVQPVILAGGSGTRLWPLSRRNFPKQFLSLDENLTLFQNTCLLFSNMSENINHSLVVVNKEHRFIAQEQLKEIGFNSSNLLLEPVGRNTAPAMTLAALYSIRDSKDPILFVMPADQIIQNKEEFNKVFRKANKLAEKGSLVVLGMAPKSPHTGYGYIKVQGEDVASFVEKPDLITATEYLSQGTYYWNAGIFVVRASVWMKALNKFRPDISEATKVAFKDFKVEDYFFMNNKDSFNNIPSESIDYAVIENLPKSNIAIKMIELDAGWSDLGSWDSVSDNALTNEDGNSMKGDIVTFGSINNYVNASSRLVGMVGVKNLMVIETADAVLIVDKKRSHDVKNIVNQLKHKGRQEIILHRKVSRPWGWYDCLEEGEGFKVKRIHVLPGAALSLQKHRYRAEHWVVVRGVAVVTCGNKNFNLSENQSTYIPLGELHRLSNLGKEILEIIEVQTGSYLGEDDIIRFEDQYGREVN